MAAAPDQGVLQQPGPPPLGAILVQRGLLTQEQLAAALEESRRTGEPTGEAIVRLGFASAATVAQALATQHGGPLKTEFGYAVGFSDASSTAADPAAAAGSPPPPPVSPVPAQDARPAAPAPAPAVRAKPPVEPVPAPAPSQPAAPATPSPEEVVRRWQQYAQQVTQQRDAALEQARTLASELEPAKALVVELERKVEELEAAEVRVAELEATATVVEVERAKLERLEEESESRIAELQQKIEELSVGAAAHDQKLADAQAKLEEAESKLDGAHEEAARAKMEKVALEAAHESMKARNEDLEARLKELEAEVTHLEAERHDVLEVARTLGERRRGDAVAHDHHAEDSAHLLFVPGREGYRLVEHEGPPPAPGSTVELPSDDEGGETLRLVVTKVAAAPFPGRRLACAYLVDAA